MNSKITGVLIGVLLILYGLFEVFTLNQREVFIGIAFIFYGIGTIMTATQEKIFVRIGIVINFITVVITFTALLFEHFFKIGLTFS